LPRQFIIHDSTNPENQFKIRFVIIYIEFQMEFMPITSPLKLHV
jgi:hypothetical protein